MSEREAFDRILALLHEAVLDDAHWPTASGLIDATLRAHGNALVCGDGHTGGDIQIYFAGFYYRGHRHRELERDYFEVYHPLDERIPRLRALPDSRLVHITDLYTEEELHNSVTFNELSSHTHSREAINIRLDGPNGSRIVWAVNDPVDGDGWSSAQLDSIRRLLPHIRQYVRVRQALAGAGALGATLAELLDTTGSGVIQLDGRGRIVAANDAARDLLRTGGGLFDEGGLLVARTPQDNDRLQALLARALPPFGTQGAGGSTMVRRLGALPPLVLHVNPVGLQETDVRLWPVAALVLVDDPTSGIRIDPAVTAAALDLTVMEGRVAVLLARGMSVRETAAATGRKESTIRSHVKHIFAKHGLSRQAELVRLVLLLAGAPEARR